MSNQFIFFVICLGIGVFFGLAYQLLAVLNQKTAKHIYAKREKKEKAAQVALLAVDSSPKKKKRRKSAVTEDFSQANSQQTIQTGSGVKTTQIIQTQSNIVQDSLRHKSTVKSVGSGDKSIMQATSSFDKSIVQATDANDKQKNKPKKSKTKTAQNESRQQIRWLYYFTDALFFVLLSVSVIAVIYYNGQNRWYLFWGLLLGFALSSLTKRFFSTTK